MINHTFKQFCFCYYLFGYNMILPDFYVQQYVEEYVHFEKLNEGMLLFLTKDLQHLDDHNGKPNVKKKYHSEILHF